MLPVANHDHRRSGTGVPHWRGNGIFDMSRPPGSAGIICQKQRFIPLRERDMRVECISLQHTQRGKVYIWYWDGYLLVIYREAFAKFFSLWSFEVHSCFQKKSRLFVFDVEASTLSPFITNLQPYFQEGRKFKALKFIHFRSFFSSFFFIFCRRRWQRVSEGTIAVIQWICEYGFNTVSWDIPTWCAILIQLVCFCILK